MKIRWRLQAVLLAAIVLITGSAYGQRFYQMQAHGSLIEVLSQEVFEATFGDNPHIPRTERAIIALAEKLYPPLVHKMEPAAPAEEITEDCGEEDVGVLFAALQNPAVSDSAGGWSATSSSQPFRLCPRSSSLLPATSNSTTPAIMPMPFITSRTPKSKTWPLSWTPTGIQVRHDLQRSQI